MHSDQLDQLATALSGAQADFSAIPKDSENPFFHSKYASLAKVVETATPVLSGHGLSVSQHLGWDGGADTLTTWLLHSSGQWINDTMRLHLPKNDAQGHGSATSYAKRYAYMAVLGLVAEEDDDGNAASSPPARATAQPASSNAEGIEALRKACGKKGMNKDNVAGLFRREFGCDPKDAKNADLNAFAKDIEDGKYS